MPQKLPSRKARALPYALVAAVWIAEIVGPSSSWWMEHVQPYVDPLGLLSVAFLAGLVVHDVIDDNSWIRECWRTSIRKFEVTALTVSHPADEPKRLEVNVWIRFLTDIKTATLAIRVHSCTGMSYQPAIHPIHIENLSNVMKDEKRTIRIAALAISYPGWKPVHSIWGPSKLSADLKAPSLIGGSKNVVFLELAGPWMIPQIHKFYVANPDYGVTPAMPALYAQYEGEDIFKT